MKVLLVSMPFGALERQALGISILKPLLQSRGISCDIRYLTFPFADIIGPETYQWLGYHLPYTAFAGDWCFTHALYGSSTPGYEDAILRRRWQQDETSVQRILWVRSQVDRFLDYALAAVPWSEYDAVGFTSTFEQNIASLALAKRIRAAFPKVKLLFGGANWEDEMGLELHRQFPFVDYVCCGESEHALPLLLEALGAKGASRDKRLARIPGIVYRNPKSGESVSTGSGAPVENLDALPAPDFSDYFAAQSASASGSGVLPGLLFESSRGCWWGAKSHCTFCGLNGNSMRFRSKSQTRSLDELKSQAARYSVQTVEAVDNILDMEYFEEFLPRLADAQLGVDVFYEVKANLSRRHLRKLKAARVTRIQPGIESISDHVLKLMRKGTTGLRNIQLLKWCAEYEIQCEWNLLYGFPGETAEDYAGILAMLPGIRHFRPPSACGPIRLDRFSPFHRTPDELGVRNLRALETMRYLYPFPEDVLKRITYYFDFDYADGRNPMDYVRPVIDYCDQWKESPGASASLHAALMPDGALGILDTRLGQRKAIRLEGWQQAAFERCDSMQPPAAIARHLMQTGFGEQPGLAEFLDDCCRRNFMITDGRNYLSTAIAKGHLRERLEQQEERVIRSVPATPLVHLGAVGA